MGAGLMPAAVGIGLKPEHYGELLETGSELGFLEVHTENCMGKGGAR